MGTSWLLATFSVIILYGFAHIEAFHQTHSSIFNLNQTYKPSFHFQPSKNWMNGISFNLTNFISTNNNLV
ncbi:hypothetical protein MtrunA17_Chr5g0427531 [Medicago truncatula]|uniref:Transmembrane protein n=1 Tax=Medicago truncatula TaxID=3880 RepID=A0A396HSC9_MEDTR|nr:hypothetical protein MtrunA17_Chr5g0427531 [Medicago truncatula]